VASSYGLSSPTQNDEPRVDWDLNFRGNLRLWPDPTPALSALANLDGREYDERAFLDTFPVAAGEKTPTDPRRVREPVETLQYAGLAYRTASPRVFHLTDLGRYVLTFLGATGGVCYANESNLPLVAIPWIRGLSHVAEYRAIWRLMRLADNRLSNRELNYAMKHIQKESDVQGVAEQVLAARDGELHALGPLMYPNEAEERKAINPQFLLAGGGGIFITVDGRDEYRRLIDSVIPWIDTGIECQENTIPRSTDMAYALAVSRAAAIPTRKTI
jgi:hypothetical protein